MAFNIGFMAFIMVIASALLLIPFMLYALDLKSHGWTAGYVALFGAMIASTDAASVSAVLRSGGWCRGAGWGHGAEVQGCSTGWCTGVSGLAYVH